MHGGPGVGAKYLTRLNEVIDEDTQLVLYDQLGGGDSDWPDDPSLWHVPRFVQELETVRSELELGQVTLYGQSWGGMLALAYTLDHPAQVEALILSNTYACGKDYLLDISDHRVSLGREMHAAMLRHEQAGTLDDPEYKDAVAELYARYLYRSSPYDSARSRAEFEEIAAEYMPEMGPAYALWGPHEFMGTGPEAYFDVSDRLGEIRVPALVLCGWYDELTPAALQPPARRRNRRQRVRRVRQVEPPHDLRERVRAVPRGHPRLPRAPSLTTGARYRRSRASREPNSMTAADESDEPQPGGIAGLSHDPLGAGSLAANVIAQAAMLVAALAHADGDGGTAAQAQRIGTRAGVLSISNDAAFARATKQLVAAATGEGDGFWLEVALGEAAATPRVICETACDLALLAAYLADTCDGVRRADYVGITIFRWPQPPRLRCSCARTS